MTAGIMRRRGTAAAALSRGAIERGVVVVVVVVFVSHIARRCALNLLLSRTTSSSGKYILPRNNYE